MKDLKSRLIVEFTEKYIHLYFMFKIQMYMYTYTRMLFYFLRLSNGLLFKSSLTGKFYLIKPNGCFVSLF